MRSASAAERGSVTAELALLVPAVVAVLGLCLASIQLTAQQVLLQDAAGIAARALGRGESPAEALGGLRERMPGLHLGQHRDGKLVCITLSQSRFLASVIPIALQASSCAAGAGR